MKLSTTARANEKREPQQLLLSKRSGAQNIDLNSAQGGQGPKHVRLEIVVGPFGMVTKQNKYNHRRVQGQKKACCNKEED